MVGRTFVTAAAGVALLAMPTTAPGQARASGGQRMQDAAANDVPRCTRKLGTVSIEDGQNPVWAAAGLSPPSRLLKVIVQRSGCFNIVDRGGGLIAASRERMIDGELGMQSRSNVGRGQIKAADYVLLAEMQGANSNVSGGGVAGAVGGLLGGRVGGLLGGLRSKKLEANTVLSLTNVRTTETLATADGYAAKNNLSIGGGGFFAIAGAIGGGYDNTDIGRIVTLSFIQAYIKLVGELGGVTPGATAMAEAAPSRAPTRSSAPPHSEPGPRRARARSAAFPPGRKCTPPATRTACGGRSRTKTTMSVGY